MTQANLLQPQKELPVPSNSDHEASRCLSYSMMAAGIDEQQQKRQQRTQFDISAVPSRDNTVNEKGNKSECLQVQQRREYFERSQNSKQTDNVFPSNFHFHLIQRQIQERVREEEQQRAPLMPDLFSPKAKRNDHNEGIALCEPRVQKKLGENLISSVMKGTLRVQLGNISEQSDILQQQESVEQASHFVAEPDSNSFNIFRQFQQSKQEHTPNDTYQIKVTLNQEMLQKPSAIARGQIERQNEVERYLGQGVSSSKILRVEESKKSDTFSFRQVERNQGSANRADPSTLGTKGMKTFENKMFVSKLIQQQQKEEQMKAGDCEVKNIRGQQQERKGLVQVANRMKSTYDPKARVSEFKNVGNFSQPDKHSAGHSGQENGKIMEPVQPSLTTHQKKESVSGQIQENMIDRLKNLEKIVDCLKEGSSYEHSMDRQKVTTNAVKPEKQSVNVKQQMKISKKIEQMKGLAPDELFNEFSSIDSESKALKKTSQKDSKNDIINSKLQYLTEKIHELQKAISKKTARESSSNLTEQDAEQEKRVLKIKYKDCNYQSRTKLLSKAKSQKKINYSSMIDGGSNQDMVELDSSIPEFQHCPLPESSPEQLAEMGIKILDAFQIKTPKGGSMDMLRFKDHVQFRLASAHLYIRWEFTGLFYLGDGFIGEELTKQGQGIEIMPKKYIFKGQFRGNKRHGEGTIRYSNGTKYKGAWKDDQYEGFGQLTTNESSYSGSFQQGTKNGKGKQHFKNGDYYEGIYSNNKFHGKGIYSWKLGMTYSGDFKEGEMDGEGIWKSAKGDRYEGQYRKNMKHGVGRYQWKSGKVFQGEFYKGERVKKSSGTIAPEHQITYEDAQVSNSADCWRFTQKHTTPTMKRFTIERQTTRSIEKKQRQGRI